MGRTIARFRGVGFILWHSRHMFYHVLIGLVYAWFLREVWQAFNPWWIAASVFFSLAPDLDHLWYFFTYGRDTAYAKDVFGMIRNGEWRSVAVFVEKGHKYNTNLSLHNYYVVVGLLLLSLVSLKFTWEFGVIAFGAMSLHYLFDIVDDIVQLGIVNPNWRRFGKPGYLKKKHVIKDPIDASP